MTVLSNKSSLSTSEILASEDAAYHLRAEVGDYSLSPSSVIGNPWISTRSRWRDDQWYLDNHTPGQRSDAVQWRFGLHDGTYFTDPQYFSLLDGFRRLLWSLFADPRNGRARTAGSASRLSRGISLLSWWMVKNDYSHFGHLDGAGSRDFLEDLPDLIREVSQRRSPHATEEFSGEQDLADEQGHDDADGTGDLSTAHELQDLKLGAVYSALNMWQALWNQRGALSDAGLSSMTELPFGGRSVNALASQIVQREIGKIPPLPDEVAAPVMAAAQRLIGEAADDVIALQSLYIDIRRQTLNDPNRPRASLAIREAVREFKFSTLDGEATPWHEPLKPLITETIHQDEVTLYEYQRIRGLVRSIRDAAVIVLLSQSGMRISEVCGLESGLNISSGLPTCIEIRRSASGMSDLFYVRGRLSKTRAAPTRADWLLGSRPVGSNWMPPPVRALEVLQHLFDPWRELSDRADVRKSLIVSFLGPRGLPSSADGIGLISNDRLLAGQRGFLYEWVNLSALPHRNFRGEDLASYRESRGTCIATHQWRKTYALYLFRINNRLLPAISQQFKHLSLAMTERAYVGNDIALLRDIDTAHVQQSVAFWSKISKGETTRLAGRMGKIIERYLPRLLEISGALEQKASVDNVRAWVLEHDLRIFHNMDGKCLMRVNPTAARCHSVAGTSHWSNKAPNYSARDTNTCLGCDAFVIDGEHEEFWTQRYINNHTAWLHAKASGEEWDFRVVRKRADQAKAVLRLLGISAPKVEVQDAP